MSDTRVIIHFYFLEKCVMSVQVKPVKVQNEMEFITDGTALYTPRYAAQCGQMARIQSCSYSFLTRCAAVVPI